MNPHDAYEPILASLYRAALDPGHWPQASALIDEACGAAGNGLVVGEGSGGDGRIHFARYLARGEPRQDLAREYLQVHYPHDTGLHRLMELPGGRLFRLAELYSEAERKTSPAYNVGWRRLGGQHGMSVHFDEPDGLRIVWSIGDPVGSGGWESAQTELIERLLPHVHQFVRMRQALATAGASDAGLAGLLDNSRIGVLQLDRSGRLLAANGPALAVLRRGDGLFDKGGTLYARLPAEHERLQKLLKRVLPGLWSASPRGGSMRLRRPSNAAPLALHVSPVGDPEADFGARRVAVLMLVVDPARRPRIDPLRVSEAFGLTASEGRIAALLSEGRPVVEVATVTGFQSSYVRLLLKRAYKKLGVSGQVALVPRILALDALPRRRPPAGRTALLPISPVFPSR